MRIQQQQAILLLRDLSICTLPNREAHFLKHADSQIDYEQLYLYALPSHIAYVTVIQQIKL